MVQWSYGSRKAVVPTNQVCGSPVAVAPASAAREKSACSAAWHVWASAYATHDQHLPVVRSHWFRPPPACVKQAAPCGRLRKRGAKDSYCYPLGATVRTDSQFAKACSRTCTIHFVRVQLQPCDQTTAVWPRLCVRGVTLDTDSPLCLVRSGRCGERPKRATGLSGACASGWVRVCVRVLRRACAHTPCCGLDRAAREAAMRSVSEPVTR